MELWYKAVLLVTLTTNLIPLSRATFEDDDGSRIGQNFDNTNEQVRSLPYSSNRITINDNTKPTFKNCNNNEIVTFPENTDYGHNVTSVTATDIDPPDQGGTLTYKLIYKEKERGLFKIDNVTGVITNNVVFDRDEPVRQKEVYVTVQATDNGRPQLSDFCSFKVIILDENDNNPIFDKGNYMESVSEDTIVGTVVMQISATDVDDGENARVSYEIPAMDTEFLDYFKINGETGEVKLTHSLSGQLDKLFKANVIATDHGNPPKTQDTGVEIRVVGSDKKYPSFIDVKRSHEMPESFRDHETTIIPLKADSNIPDDSHVTYELVTGKTQQSNKDLTFVLEPIEENEARIILGRSLDYESINEYTLTVRITNRDALAATVNINIKITDVNDNIPAFIEVNQGSVLENEPAGSPVMQVRAIDLDGTEANNIVTYRLSNPEQQKLFSIDSKTGNITTKQEFDREKTPSYNLRVVAEDNSPSALLTNKHPNTAIQDFLIIIEDKNDNPPSFTQKKYLVDQILESTDIGKDVIEIKAKDKDTASQIYYSITGGNEGEAFMIEPSTGKIRVKNGLDFEKIEKYTLKVEAFDGKYSDNAEVTIQILNVNDELPIFDHFEKNITIWEERDQPGCILNLHARDPDVKDPSAPQNIKYRIVNVNELTKDDITVNQDGCVMVTKKLDRDPPNGLESRQIGVAADDENGGIGSQTTVVDFFIHLKDINDNAPYLKVRETVWYENQSPGMIMKLEALDNDSNDNGPPFTFKMGSAGPDILGNFDVRDGNLYALEEFDREQRKFYMVPISITDSPKDTKQPSLTGEDFLKVIIGDLNDNEMRPGSSEIFVYDYKGSSPDMQIGRVYVDDPDDWDLPDKTFAYREYSDINRYFELNTENGTLTKRQGTPADTYELEFDVTEEINHNTHNVKALVTVIVKEIPEEAVIKSGSIRLEGITPEEFVEKPDNGKSKKDILQSILATKLNTSLANVDVFTVFSSKKNDSWTDVRFSAHGSPYYMPEKLNSEISNLHGELEKTINGQIVMINIDECLLESVCPLSSSCFNKLVISDYPAVVFTNKTSFVGVSAIVEPKCVCSLDSNGETEAVECFNGGTLVENSICNCLPGYDGINCEKLDIGFHGDGWALYPTFGACNDSELALEISPNNDNSLIFYIGPQSIYPTPLVRDFMALELRDGYPVLFVDYGTGTVRIEKRFKKLTDGNRHRIDIKLQPLNITMIVDGCANTSCLALNATPGANKLLNVNGPLQLGGVSNKNLLTQLSRDLGWQFAPTELGFHGCVHNLTFNRKTYNLGAPSMEKQMAFTCDGFVAKAVTFGIDPNFLIAILVCIAILIFLLLAVVVHRRKHDNLNEKDIDDIRENIINYEDEGGGEVDTGYDLDVLRRGDMDTYMGKPPIKDGVYGQCPEVPDISGFLDTKKDVCDKDPDNNPFDDVRHYAYEGDGNTSGSLSSLASCTDEGDLKFNYLSNFGPRFRKLADMYGEEPSDDDSHDGGEESWC